MAGVAGIGVSAKDVAAETGWPITHTTERVEKAMRFCRTFYRAAHERPNDSRRAFACGAAQFGTLPWWLQDRVMKAALEQE